MIGQAMRPARWLARPVAAPVLALTVLVLALAGLAGLGANLWAAWIERDGKAELAERLAAFDRKGRPMTPAPSGDVVFRPRILAATETLAAAALDARIRATAADASAVIVESRAERAHDDNGDDDRRIEAHAILEGTMEAMQAILVRLETDAPMFVITSLDLQPVQPVGGETQAAAILRATLQGSGWWDKPK